MVEGPRCPNHLVKLILTDTPGIGICPVSDCRFGYEHEDDKAEWVEWITSWGTVERMRKVTPLDEGEPAC